MSSPRLTALKSTQKKIREIGFRVDGTPTGVNEAQTITMPATAGATQADYIVVENQAGIKYAFWIDIDDNGTVPTGAEYVASDVQTRLDMATGGTATQNGAILAAAAAVMANTTILDNLDGTVLLTQDIAGATTNPVPMNADDSGVGSITAVITTAGVTGAISIAEGVPDADLTSSGIGDYTLTFTESFARIPVVSVGVLTAQTMYQVFSVAVGSVRIKFFDAADGTTPKDADFHLLAFGDMYADAR